MPTILEAAADAQFNYTPGQRVNMFCGDVVDIKAAGVVGGCTCRGACGSHTGPCSMKAAKGVAGGKMCKACAMAANKKK